MGIFDRALEGRIFFDFWKQVQNFLFSENRLLQLITLKPIEIYKTETEIEIDTAKIKLNIKSNVENLMQRRIERTYNLLTLNNSQIHKYSPAYNFDITIKAFIAYDQVSNFFNFHFGQQTYTIEKDKYFIDIHSFQFSSLRTKAVVHMPFTLNAKWWKFNRQMQGIAIFNGSINFHQPKYVIKTRNLRYELQTESLILKWIDIYYHDKLVAFLADFLQHNFKEELFSAKTEAQLQINSFESQHSWVKGFVSELDLERITIEPQGIQGVFLAEGKLHLM